MAERTLYFLKSAKEICLYHRLTTCRNFLWRTAKIGDYYLVVFSNTLKLKRKTLICFIKMI